MSRVDENIIEERLNTLKDIASFVDNIERDNIMFIQSLGWNIDSIKGSASKIQCPIDASHLVSAGKFKDHCEKCKLTSEDYRPDDVLLPDSFGSSHVINLGPELTSKIIGKCGDENKDNLDTENKTRNYERIPQSADRMKCMYTPKERCAIYDHIISQTSSAQEVPEEFYSVDRKQNDSCTKSDLVLRAETRDLKRRRTKYKVSTKSKTYTEIIREVIQNQISTHIEYMNKSEGRKSDFGKIHYGNLEQTETKSHKSYHDKDKGKRKCEFDHNDTIANYRNTKTTKSAKLSSDFT